MKHWLWNNKLVLTGVALGAAAGYIYWKQIGCTSGTCAITSHWDRSTAYGALMGGLLFSILKKDRHAGDKSK